MERGLLLVETRIWVSGGDALARAERDAQIFAGLNESEIREAAW